MTLQLIRLTKRQDFVRLSKMGQKAIASGLVLQVAATPQEERQKQGQKNVARLGFTVSGKVGNAVVRNRVRRRLKAVVATILPNYAKPGFDYVIVGRSAALKRPYESLKKDIKYTLHKTGTFHVENPEQSS